MIFRRLGNAHYRLADAEHGIEFDVDRLRRDRNGELVGELAVACGMLGTRAIDGRLSIGAFNLSSVRSRQERGRALAQQARTGNKIDFLAALEELCQRVLTAEREGTPAVDLRDVPRPAPDAEIDVDGLRLPAAHASILFGDGGTLKSFTALHILGRLAIEGRSVALFDWELDQFTHRLRLERLFGSEMPGALRYVRCERPLVYEADHLARVIQKHDVEFGVFDSAGFATDGAPESAEAALAYFRALRQLGIGSLHIAHTTKNGDQAEYRPFGSAFWHNSARCSWFAKQASTSADGRTVTVGLYHRKANLGPQRPPIAFEVAFSDERTTFSRVDPSGVEEMVESLPLWLRVKAEVSRGPKTFAEIADSLGVKVDSVEKAVKRKGEVFARVSGSTDGIRRVALLERRAS